LPPFAGSFVTVYVLDCVPPPHVAEHTSQPPQTMAQSTGSGGGGTGVGAGAGAGGGAGVEHHS
jgi:hypothetical protein